MRFKKLFKIPIRGKANSNGGDLDIILCSYG
jgi:hypothetical protein